MGFGEATPVLAALGSVDVRKTIDVRAYAHSELAETLSRPTARASGQEPAGGLLPGASLPRLALQQGDDDGEGESFKIERVLGQGGMGQVLLARQRGLGREVALKVLPAEHGEFAERSLLSEAYIAGLLEHPNIIPIHMVGRDELGRPVMVMKYVDGVPWSKLLQDPGHPWWANLPTAGADRLAAHLSILMSACDAAHYAHSRGVVHRDFKPDNVMVGRFGEVYVTDWGIATLRAQGGSDALLVGTPSMMAPEMLSGNPREVDERTDVYLLGATLHTILTGAPRHGSTNLLEVLRQASESAPAAYEASVPEELGAICNRATARAPADRYPTALALRQAVAGYLQHQGAVALSDAAGERLQALRALLDAPLKPGGAALDAEAHGALLQIGVECRFGFGQALRAWPENAVAAEGLEATLELLARYELCHGDLANARGLIGAMKAPAASLREALDERQARTLVEQQRAGRLAQLEAEFNLSTASAHRRALLGLTLATAATFTVSLVASRLKLFGPAITQGRLVANFSFLLAVTAAFVGLRRRELLSTAINRRIVGMLLTSLAVITLHRIAGWRADAPVGAIVVSDMAIMLAATSMATIAVTRALWPVPLLHLLGLLTVAAFPATRAWAFSLSSMLALVGMAVVWGRISARERG